MRLNASKTKTMIVSRLCTIYHCISIVAPIISGRNCSEECRPWFFGSDKYQRSLRKARYFEEVLASLAWSVALDQYTVLQCGTRLPIHNFRGYWTLWSARSVSQLAVCFSVTYIMVDPLQFLQKKLQKDQEQKIRSKLYSALPFGNSGTSVADRYSYALPLCRTTRYPRNFIPQSVSLWNDFDDSVFDGVVLRRF